MMVIHDVLVACLALQAFAFHVRAATRRFALLHVHRSYIGVTYVYTMYIKKI